MSNKFASTNQFAALADISCDTSPTSAPSSRSSSGSKEFSPARESSPGLSDHFGDRTSNCSPGSEKEQDASSNRSSDKTPEKTDAAKSQHASFDRTSKGPSASSSGSDKKQDASSDCDSDEVLVPHKTRDKTNVAQGQDASFGHIRDGTSDPSSLSDHEEGGVLLEDALSDHEEGGVLLEDALSDSSDDTDEEQDASSSITSDEKADEKDAAANRDPSDDTDEERDASSDNITREATSDHPSDKTVVEPGASPDDMMISPRTMSKKPPPGANWDPSNETDETDVEHNDSSYHSCEKTVKDLGSPSASPSNGMEKPSVRKKYHERRYEHRVRANWDPSNETDETHVEHDDSSNRLCEKTVKDLGSASAGPPNGMEKPSRRKKSHKKRDGHRVSKVKHV